MEIRPVFNQPQAAAVARPELDRAAKDLYDSGHSLSRLESSFWKREHWERANPPEAAEAMAANKELRLETKQGQQLKVASGEDLLEASALLGKGPTEPLGSPLLAGGLKALDGQGQFKVNGQLTNPYVAYNALTQDPNHPAGRVEFEVGPLKILFQKPEDALTAAYLAAGFGDGTGVDERARNLSDLARQGLQFSNGSALAAYHAPATVSYDGVQLGAADTPEVGQKLAEYQTVKRQLGQDAKTWWDTLQAPSERPLEDRARLAQLAGDQGSYRAVLESARQGEKLDDAVRPLLEARAVLPQGSPEAIKAYGVLRALEPEPARDYLENLASCPDAALARTAQTDPQVGALLQELRDRKVEPGQIRGLLQAAQTSGETELLLAATSYPNSSELYHNWLQGIPVEGRAEFLAMQAEEPHLEQLHNSWNVLIQDQPNLAKRREAWSFLRTQYPPEQATEQAIALLSQIKSDDPLGAARTYLRLQKNGEVPAEQLAEVWGKLQASPNPSAALELYLVGKNADQAVTASRWLERRDLPAGHNEALIALAKAHEGNLDAATRDLLFVASKHPEELVEASKMMSELLDATGSSREARLAFAALETMDPEQGATRSESLLQALRTAGTYEDVQPIWQTLCALPPEEGKRRLAGLTVDPVMPRGLRNRLLEGQLRAPLEPAGLTSLNKLLESPSLLRWTGQEGWAQKDGAWKFSGTLTKDQDRYLESSPLKLPAGENTLVWDGAWQMPDKSGAYLYIAEAGSKDWKHIGSVAGTGQGPVDPIKLDPFWSGKNVHFALRASTYGDVPAPASFDLKGLKLSERRVGPVQSLGISTWSQTTSGYDSDTTSPWFQLDAASPSELEASIQVTLRNTSNHCTLEIQSESMPDFRAIKFIPHTSDYNTVSDRFDLSSYQGQKVRFRWRLTVYKNGTASYDSPKTSMYEPVLRPILKDQSGAARLTLYDQGGLSEAEANRALDLAYGEGDAATRSKAIGTLSRLASTTGDYEAAWKVWDKMSGDLSKPEFEDRAVAYAALLGKGEEADVLFSLVESEREAGEKLEPAARLLAERTPDDWRALRRRVKAEGMGQPLASSMEFLAGLGSHVESVDRAWETVATPVLGESLAERQDAFGRLAAATGNLDGALALYGQIGQWLEPKDSVPAAVDAVAQLARVLGKDQTLIQSTLKFIQDHQQSGELAGQTLSACVKRLTNAMVVREGAPPALEQALQELLIPVVGPGAIQEQADKIIVGGVQVPKKG